MDGRLNEQQAKAVIEHRANSFSRRNSEGTNRNIRPRDEFEFYVANKVGEVEYRIQTENSVISVELGGPKYILGMNKGDTHSTFNVGFNEDFNYDDLKGTVIEVLEEKLKPSASSRPGKE